MDKDFMEQGCFYVPHFLYNDDLGLTKNQRGVLYALFALQDMFLSKIKGRDLRGWFNISNKDLCWRAGICEDTLRVQRLALVKKGLIEYKQGYKGRNSDYRILIDNFYLGNKFYG